MAQTSNGTQYVIIMGPIGSGKNHFIWAASGQGEDRIQHKMVQGPVDISPIEWKPTSPAAGQPPVMFVDTTGFEDLQISWLRILFKRLNKDIKDKNGELAGIILLHQIATNQIPSSTIHPQLRTLQDLCGTDVMKNVVVATTMWDDGLPEATAKKRHADLRAALFDGTTKWGCKLAEYRGTKKSAWESIDYLLNQQSCTPILVQPETDEVGCWSKLCSCFK